MTPAVINLVVGTCLFFQLIHAAPAGELTDDFDYETYKEQYPEEIGDDFEGDIDVEPSFRNAVKYPHMLWPKGQVYYTFSDEVTSSEKEAMKLAMNAIEKSTCIRFIPRTNQPSYLNIVKKKKGCSSKIGMRSKNNNPQEMKLSHRCFNRHGTMIHELMHTIGFVHEQTRYDRDKFVKIVFENVKKGHERNFKMHNPKDITLLGTRYDYGSIMHYSRWAFSKNGKKTIIPTDTRARIGQRTAMSPLDIRKINLLYKCKTKQQG